MNSKAVNVEQEILDAIRGFDRAASQGNVETASRMIAEGYTHCDIFGRLQDKATWLDAYLRPLASQLSLGEFHWEIYASDDVRVRAIAEGVAVAVGVWTLKKSSSAEILRGRFTHVWIKGDGHWQRAAYHATLVGDERLDADVPI